MKAITLLLIFSALLIVQNSSAQFLERLGKSAERAAKKTVEKRVERETEKKTDQAMDSLFNTGKKDPKQTNSPLDTVKDGSEGPLGNGPEIIHAKDFERGTISLFEDDFSRDRAGDFPSKWDTNGSGEIASIDGNKWFRLRNNALYIPMVQTKLPDNYTIEFDLFTNGLDRNTSSQAFMKLLLDDTNDFQNPKNHSIVEISPCQYVSSPGVVEKWSNGQRQIRNDINKDYREIIKGYSHISIAVNKTRMRVWINDNKIVDVPRLVPEGITTFKIETTGLRDDQQVDEIYISKFILAETGTDYRSQLITEGRLSTTAILFNTGSSQVKSGADKIMPQISEAMEAVPDMNILIVGHTDADGSAETNKALSQQRAEAVKTILTSQYHIDPSRIVTDGKGESEPVGDNNTPDGKAENRRVEFIRI